MCVAVRLSLFLCLGSFGLEAKVAAGVDASRVNGTLFWLSTACLSHNGGARRENYFRQADNSRSIKRER